MGFSINQVCLAGRLGADPVLRYTKSGTAVLNMSIATTSSYKDGNEWKEQTDWHSVVVFGKISETLANALKKGTLVSVCGSLRTSSYEKNGEKRYKTEVNARDIAFDGARHQSEDAPQAPAQTQQAANGYDFGDDDLNF